MKTLFATSNPGKYKEAENAFKAAGLELEQYKTNITEIQSNALEEVAYYCVRQAYKEALKPIFVEDAGLFITALDGFPGVYSKFVFHTIGLDGILKLMEGVRDRSAEFRAVIGYTNGHEQKVFKGICKGNIALEARGRGGFGFDPIFLPEGKDKTFAEDVKAKASLSHRAQALKGLIEYLKGH